MMIAARLSVVVITKNAGGVIERCLESVRWADEIIIVDSFSADRTVEIARRYTDKIFLNNSLEYPELYKNLGMEKAMGDWILLLDADETVPSELKAEIARILMENDKRFDGYFIFRRCYFLGRWMRYGGWYEYAPILVMRGKGKYPRGIHKVLVIDGKMGHLRNPTVHACTKDTAEWIDKMNSHTAFEAKEMVEKGLKFNVAHVLFFPIAVFLRQYLWRKGYKDGFHGFIAAVFASFYEFVRHVKLWEDMEDDGR